MHPDEHPEGQDVDSDLDVDIHDDQAIPWEDEDDEEFQAWLDEQGMNEHSDGRAISWDDEGLWTWEDDEAEGHAVHWDDEDIWTWVNDETDEHPDGRAIDWDEVEWEDLEDPDQHPSLEELASEETMADWLDRVLNLGQDPSARVRGRREKRTHRRPGRASGMGRQGRHGRSLRPGTRR